MCGIFSINTISCIWRCYIRIFMVSRKCILYNKRKINIVILRDNAGLLASSVCTLAFFLCALKSFVTWSVLQMLGPRRSKYDISKEQYKHEDEDDDDDDLNLKSHQEEEKQKKKKENKRRSWGWNWRCTRGKFKKKKNWWLRWKRRRFQHQHQHQHKFKFSRFYISIIWATTTTTTTTISTTTTIIRTARFIIKCCRKYSSKSNSWTGSNCCYRSIWPWS